MKEEEEEEEEEKEEEEVLLVAKRRFNFSSINQLAALCFFIADGVTIKFSISANWIARCRRPRAGVDFSAFFIISSENV